MAALAGAVENVKLYVIDFQVKGIILLLHLLVDRGLMKITVKTLQQKQVSLQIDPSGTVGSIDVIIVMIGRLPMLSKSLVSQPSWLHPQ